MRYLHENLMCLYKIRRLGWSRIFLRLSTRSSTILELRDEKINNEDGEVVHQGQIRTHEILSEPQTMQICLQDYPKPSEPVVGLKRAIMSNNERRYYKQAPFANGQPHPLSHALARTPIYKLTALLKAATTDSLSG